MSAKMVPLTRGLPVLDGGSILYVYDQEEIYLENLLAFLRDGLRMQHKIYLFDDLGAYKHVIQILSSEFSDDFLSEIIFQDVYSRSSDLLFWGDQEIAETDSIPKANRFWLHDRVDLMRLETVKRHIDVPKLFVHAHGIAALSGEEVFSLLRTHEYLMTDHELLVSPLFPQDSSKVPSLSSQSSTDNELDLYKKKLDFVHVVSHEVRNPLTILSGFATILLETEPSISPRGKEKLYGISHYVKSIDQELSHLIETEEMLAEELYIKLDAFCIEKPILQVIDMMRTKSHVQHIDFIVERPLSLTDFMMGNPMGLRLILSNLISNALKYSREGEAVRFTIHLVNDQVCFIIEDQGIGMTQKQMRSLFRKYGKINEEKSGQGIGLYVVKRLTDLFGGSIEIESQLGQGTIVTVTFPLILFPSKGE
nr:HAMP domain-containing histidine kinase [Bacilli bacterium]